MAIPADPQWDKLSGHTGTGPLSFDFQYSAKADLRVFVTDPGVGPVIDDELSSGGFTHTPGATLTTGLYDGGSISLVTSVTNKDVYVVRDWVKARTTAGSSNAVTLTTLVSQVDALVGMIQDVDFKADAALKVSIGETAPYLGFADDRPSAALATNADGEIGWYDKTDLTELVTPLASRWIDITDYLACDGTDETAEFQTACDAADAANKILRSYPHLTITITDGVKLCRRSENLVVDIIGLTASDTTTVHRYGAIPVGLYNQPTTNIWDSSYAKTTLAGAENRGESDIVMTSGGVAAAGLAENDYIIINEVANWGTFGNAKKTDYKQITAISSETVSLDSYLETASYSSSATVRKYPAYDVHHKGLHIIGAGSTVDQYGYVAVGCRHVVLEDCSAEDVHYQAYGVLECFSLAVTTNFFVVGADDQGLGYALNTSGTGHVDITCAALIVNCKHGLTGGAGFSTQYQLTRHVNVTSIEGIGCTDSVVDQHPGCVEMQVGNVKSTCRSDSSSGDGAVVWQGSRIQAGQISSFGCKRDVFLMQFYGDGDGLEAWCRIGSLVARSATSSIGQFAFSFQNESADPFGVIDIGHIDSLMPRGVYVDAKTASGVIDQVRIGSGYVKSQATNYSAIYLLCTAANINRVSLGGGLTAIATATAAGYYAIYFAGTASGTIGRVDLGHGIKVDGGDYGLRADYATVYGPLPAFGTHTSGNTTTGTSGTFTLDQVVATTSSPTFATPTVTSINIGSTSTTITESAAGVIAVEGGVVPKENRANTFSLTQTISDGTNGRLTLAIGDSATQTGHINFLKGDGTSLGRIGNNATNLNLVLQNSAALAISGGNVTLSGTMQISSAGGQSMLVSSSAEPYFEAVDTTATTRAFLQGGNAVVNFGSISNHVAHVFTNNTSRWSWGTDGHYLPTATETYNIGSASFEVNNIFTQNAVTVSDARRKNDLGEIGGDEALAFLDALTPRWFSFKPTEVPPSVRSEEIRSKRIVRKPVERIVSKPVEHTITKDDGEKVIEIVMEDVVEHVLRDVEEDHVEIRKVPVPGHTIAHSRPHTGFFAQEVKDAMTAAGIKDWAGYAYEEKDDAHVLRLTEMIAVLAAAVKELKRRLP